VSEFETANVLISVLDLATEAGTQSGAKDRVKQIQQDEKNEALDDNYPHRNHATNAEYRTPNKQIGETPSPNHHKRDPVLPPRLNLAGRSEPIVHHDASVAAWRGFIVVGSIGRDSRKNHFQGTCLVSQKR
jgi:hypothetical protein